jgi:hypothetical protein
MSLDTAATMIVLDLEASGSSSSTAMENESGRLHEAIATEVVPTLVELEVAVPRLSPAMR